MTDLHTDPARGSSIAVAVARLPAPTHGLRHRLAKLVLRLGGWTTTEGPPDLPKYVIVAAPHTAWVDGFWMIAFAWYWDVDMSWMVKHTQVRFPFRWLLKQTGAIAVNRSAPRGLVGELTRQFQERSELRIAIPAEGTRVRRTHWKSGFYQLARAADVPVCLSYLDYGRRQAGFGPCWKPSGDVRADMDFVREFYRDMVARHPDQFTTPRLKEEEDAEEGADAAPAELPRALP